MSLIGMERRAPATMPSAVPVIWAFAGSPQPSGRTTSTALLNCGALPATGLPMVRKNPPASATFAHDRAKQVAKTLGIEISFRDRLSLRDTHLDGTYSHFLPRMRLPGPGQFIFPPF